MRPNSFKKGQRVKVIEQDGSLRNAIGIVQATCGYACWVKFESPFSSTPDFYTYGANRLESVK